MLLKIIIKEKQKKEHPPKDKGKSIIKTVHSED
jgi:hypothetical protein